MANKNLIIVEGETEEKFVKDFKEYLKKPAKVEKINVFNNKLKPGILGNKWDYVYFIIDTDLTNSNNLKRFNLNYKTINAKHKFVLLQDKNFEDELCYIYKKNKNNLYKNVFDCMCVSDTEFKGNFIKNNNLKLKFVGINLSSLYERGSHFIDLNGINLTIKKNIKKGEDFFKNKIIE